MIQVARGIRGFKIDDLEESSAKWLKESPEIGIRRSL
jgi:hypothetical protein